MMQGTGLLGDYRQFSQGMQQFGQGLMQMGAPRDPMQQGGQPGMQQAGMGIPRGFSGAMQPHPSWNANPFMQGLPRYWQAPQMPSYQGGPQTPQMEMQAPRWEMPSWFMPASWGGGYK
jgi:hypothetical protein